MKPNFTSSPVSEKPVIFFVSSLLGACGKTGVVEVPLAVAPDGSLWAIASDLRIEPAIMKRILNRSVPAHFHHANRIFVNLEVVLEVCDDEILAFRVRYLIANCLRLRQSDGFSNWPPSLPYCL